jgi:ketosteroid isomerase-like protein
MCSNGELLIETGTAQGNGDSGEEKYSFPYLLVWKKEDGAWKIYRDISL